VAWLGAQNARSHTLYNFANGDDRYPSLTQPFATHSLATSSLPREMRWSGRALTEGEREVFPVPDGPITRSIGSLIDNERGSESGADDKSLGFAKDGVWGAGLPASMGSQLVDRLLGCRSDSCCFSCLLVHLRWTIARYSLVVS